MPAISAATIAEGDIHWIAAGSVILRVTPAATSSSPASSPNRGSLIVIPLP